MNKDLKRVLVVTREVPPVGGGAGHVAINLAENIAKMRVKVDIVTMHFDGLAYETRSENIRVYRLDVGRRNIDSSYSFEMLKFVYAAKKKVKALMRKYDYQIIHSHAIVPDGLVSLLFPQNKNIPNVITTHGSDVPDYNPDNFKFAHRLISPLWKLVVKRADVIVSPSSFQKELLKKSSPKVRAVIINNGIDTSIFSDSIVSDEARFLIVSRLVGRKNYALFFDALEKIDEPVRVDIVGDGPCLPKLKEQASKLTKHVIVFHGWLKNNSSEWVNLYKKARYFIFPSSRENFPINLLEAQLSKTLVIASSIPANKEVLGDNALFFDVDSLDDFYRIIIRSLQLNLSDYEDRVNRAHKRVLTNFSWKFVSGQYLSLYLSLLKNNYEY